MKCANCRRENDYQICSHCWQFAVSQLKLFPQKYHDLEKELIPTKGYGERVGGTKTPPIPVRVETLHLRTGGISHPITRHEAEMRNIRKERVITFRGEEINKITLSCQYVIDRADWAYESYWDVAELAKDIIAISNKIQYVLGFKSEDIVIGRCPTPDENGQLCGTKLRINPQNLERSIDIKCKSCGTVWESSKWRLLGKILDAQN